MKSIREQIISIFQENSDTHETETRLIADYRWDDVINSLERKGIISTDEPKAENLPISHVGLSLPSDEDISKQADAYKVPDINESISRQGGFIVGARWMREKIQGNEA